MNTINIVTTQNIELEYQLGSVGDRIVGRILDWLVLGAYIVILLLLANFNSSVIGEGTVWIMILLALPIVFYDLACEILLNGQSVGKKVMGIKVISLSGEQPNLGQYMIRWVFRIVDFSFSGSLVALITVAASQKKQRVGDMVAGTVLVKTKPRTHFTDTWYKPTPYTNYTVFYPEVINLKDSDIQLIKEVLSSVSRSGNTSVAWQAQAKIEQVLNIRSRHIEATEFLNAVLTDYNHLTSQL